MSGIALSTIQILVGLVFATAVVPKLLNPREFVGAVEDYQILKINPAFAAWGVISIEGALAVSHIFHVGLRRMIPLGVGALIAFSIAIVINLARGRRLPCHCFGASTDDILSLRSLLRVAVILALESILLADIVTGRDATGDFLFGRDPQHAVEALLNGVTIFTALFWLNYASDAKYALTAAARTLTRRLTKDRHLNLNN